MRIMCWIQKQNGENGYPVGGAHSKNATGGVDGFGYPYLTPPFFYVVEKMEAVRKNENTNKS